MSLDSYLYIKKKKSHPKYPKNLNENNPTYNWTPSATKNKHPSKRSGGAEKEGRQDASLRPLGISTTNYFPTYLPLVL